MNSIAIKKPDSMDIPILALYFAYQICNLIFFPRNSTVLILKSMPIVEINVEVNASSENRKSIQVLPTPESPINSNLNNKSYVFFAMAVFAC